MGFTKVWEYKLKTIFGETYPQVFKLLLELERFRQINRIVSITILLIISLLIFVFLLK